ncbi:MAG: helix-turn-helix domain containing protein, partial [Deltaproteobacteria bacterium]|nr:helix-turn-helix domain containing protein [Deltaproteobacteria bacterium]
MTNTTPTQPTLRPNPSIVERIVLQLQEGRDARYIAETLFLALSTVYFWIRRFTTEGPENTTYKKRGRPVGSGKMMTPE